MSANQSSHAADEAAIRSVLSSYQDALNASNTEAVMPLYSEDGVFMPSAKGRAAFGPRRYDFNRARGRGDRA